MVTDDHMELVSSKLVQEASELPSIALVFTAALGPPLWILGWRIHRALFVAASTVLGGVYGLIHGPTLGMYPVVAAGLLSLSAGGLSLAVLRIGVFVVFGSLLEFAVRGSVAEHVDDQSQIWLRVTAFLIGGLLSLACYRFLVIALTSFAGAFVLLVGSMAFAVRQGELDTIALASERPRLITITWIVLGVAGGAVQYVLETYRVKDKKARDPAIEMMKKLLKSRSSE